MWPRPQHDEQGDDQHRGDLQAGEVEDPDPPQVRLDEGERRGGHHQQADDGGEGADPPDQGRLHPSPPLLVSASR